MENVRLFVANAYPSETVRIVAKPSGGPSGRLIKISLTHETRTGKVEA
jgi:hypothetical protein